MMAAWWCLLIGVIHFYFADANILFGNNNEASNNMLGLLRLGGDNGNCYDQLGCFPNDYPWKSPLRPVPSPDEPRTVRTKLFFFSRNTRDQASRPRLWPQPSMEDFDFNPDRQETIFISHGYMETGNKSWPHDMKNRLLAKFDANVFIVDWGNGAYKWNYFQAVSNTRIVGAEIARFLRFLVEKYNLNLDKVHLIGHSLGAHIVAYAAKEFNGKIGQISALDPAQPGFEGTPPKCRLTQTDATFVEAIHTNARFFIPNCGFGMMAPVGHVDIYVNGGLSQYMCQPRQVTVVEFDKLATLPLDAVYKLGFACHHQMSVYYFIESIDSDCRMWAFKVETHEALFNALSKGVFQPVLSGLKECSAEKCTVLGPDAKNFQARGVFATTTSEKAPYCDNTMHPCYDDKLMSQIEGRVSSCNDKDFQPDMTWN